MPSVGYVLQITDEAVYRRGPINRLSTVRTLNL